ncbi:MAG: site-specific integrase [Bacteroidales bacterium]|nr:site-specific integrase [Bacteroidales bacterium]
MKHSPTKFIVRKDYASKTGQTTVYLRTNFNNRQHRFALPLLVNPKNWDDGKQRVNKHEFEHWDKNKMLDFYDAQTKAYTADCQIKKKPQTLEGLKMALFGRTTSDNYFKFAKAEIEEDITLSKETKRTYLAKLTKLERFRSNLKLSDIDYKFLMDYKKWMIVSGNETNTWNKDLSIIRSFLNRAINKGLLDSHDFDKVKIKSVEGKREFLTMDELQTFRKLYSGDLIIDRRLKKILHLFLFTCYTGLRYQDLKGLKFENIKDDFIVLTMHKTNKPVNIPLINEAKKMLPDKGKKSDNEAVFSVPTNQVFNRYLKELAKIADIKKAITLHCARHTFATLALDSGMKLEVISKILGHSSLKVTLIYAKILQSQKVESMNAFNQAIAGL